MFSLSILYAFGDYDCALFGYHIIIIVWIHYVGYNNYMYLADIIVAMANEACIKVSCSGYTLEG